MKNNTFEEIWKKLKESKKILMSLHSGRLLRRLI